MGLEHELLELNVAYQNSIAVAADLRERCQALEQLVNDLLELVQDEDQSLGQFRRHRAELEQRAKELLGLDEELETITITGDNPADYIL